MSIIKNSGGPYVIHTINAADPIILDSGNVIINGNVFVRGNTTTISTTNTNIYDNIIELNSGLTGTGQAPTLNAGIQVDRGTSPNVALIWNEGTKKWTATQDGTTYYNLVSTTTGNTRVVDDSSPQLGANLSTANNAIVNYSSQAIYIAPTFALKLDGNLQVKKYQSVTQTPIANYVLVTASNIGTGGSGLYVTNDEGISNQELITKSRAVVYSIIF
jgi:hypothetical protein